MTRREVEVLVTSIRTLLDDPDALLTRHARLRWEGALTALEVVLGQTPTIDASDGRTFNVSRGKR